LSLVSETEGEFREGGITQKEQNLWVLEEKRCLTESRLGQGFMVWKGGLEEYSSGKGSLNYKKTLAKFRKTFHNGASKQGRVYFFLFGSVIL